MQNSAAEQANTVNERSCLWTDSLPGGLLDKGVMRSALIRLWLLFEQAQIVIFGWN